MWEVRAAALSLSPVWGAARGTVPGGGERGLALRFPRFVRARPDKRARDATSSAQLAQMFARQPEATAAIAAASAVAGGAEAPTPEQAASTADSPGAAMAAAEVGGLCCSAAQSDTEGGATGDVIRGVAPSSSGGKFWQAEIHGKSLTITWGKIGSKGQSKTTRYDSEEAARAQREKVRTSKARANPPYHFS